MQNHVQFDDSFFKKTINEYQDWQFAFFRETGQNGSDAGAKNIRYEIVDCGDYIKVVCFDDGHGMTKDILLRKFLVMGGSHKQEGSVGGFGYAKSIILFCHSFYRIHTTDQMLTGGYGRYSDPVDSVMLNGTQIEVHISKDGTSVYTLENKLREWVGNSSLKNTKVFLNNEELDQVKVSKLKFQNNTKIGHLSFSPIVDGYSYYSTLWVRMRGMAMFSKIVYSNSQHFDGYIDLDAESSLDCLTANRDGLKPIYDQGLSSLLQQLSDEMTSYQISNMESFQINESVKRLKETTEESESIPFSQDSMFDYKEERKERKRNKHQQEMQVIMGETQLNEILSSERQQKALLSDKINDIINKISDYKYPDNFGIFINDLKGKKEREILKEYKKAVKFLNQSRLQKQSYLWISVVKEVLKAAKNGNLISIQEQKNDFFYNGKQIDYGVVLSNDNDVLGCNSETKKSHSICYNPLLFKEKQFTRADMLYIAIHEVVHLVCKEHNESFCAYHFALSKLFNDSKVNINKL